MDDSPNFDTANYLNYVNCYSYSENSPTFS